MEMDKYMLRVIDVTEHGDRDESVPIGKTLLRKRLRSTVHVFPKAVINRREGRGAPEVAGAWPL